MKLKLLFRKLTLTILFFTSALIAKAQSTGTLKGNVKDDKGEVVKSASIIINKLLKGTSTDENGNYQLSIPSGTFSITASYSGQLQEKKTVVINDGKITEQNFILAAASDLNVVQVIGTRNTRRVATETPVPVDVLDISSLTKAAPQANLTQILNFVAPSFTSNTATVADGTDHLDPAQLRGLGPDQVLVLMNGKRRHTSALVNVNGTPGRGSVGTDLNAIPAFAIDRIEVLRDGASAQYGSDAIAGVINVVMKKNIKKFTASVFAGGNASVGANDFRKGMDGEQAQIDMNYGIAVGKKGIINLTGSLQARNETRRATDYNGGDKNNYNSNGIYNIYNAIEARALKGGVNLSSLFGNITNTPNTAQIINTIQTYAPQVSHLTGAQQTSIAAASTIATLQGILNADVTNAELAYRGLERRDFNMRIGQSKLYGGQLFMNTIIPTNTNATFYTFGGFGIRKGNSAGFYRRPSQARTSTQLYPNGFLPEIASDITDASLAVGVRGKISEWNYDVSNTLGNNKFVYGVENTANATQGIKSATKFKAGSLGFTQSTANLDLSRGFDKVLEGLNVAFGAEYRIENYKLKAGDENSYERYDINGIPATSTTPSNQLVTDFFGAARAGGAQVFPGFAPANARNESRNSVAGYVDLELNPTKEWLINTAIRFENFSDFGSTFNYKFATRLKIANGLNLRGAIATGFRAPSLQQINFNATGTQFIGGNPFEVGTFTNESVAAQKLGIPKLTKEDSYSYSTGFTYKIPSTYLTFTMDGYLVKIKNRIVLTGQFARPGGTPTGDALILQQAFDAAKANSATFFTNAINTESKGIDVILTNRFKFDNFLLKTDLAGTISKTKQVGDIKGSDILKNTGNINRYFDEASRTYLQSAVPTTKFSFMNTLTTGKFEIFLRQTFFGKVTDPNTTDVNGDGVEQGEFVNGLFIATEHPVWGARTITDFSVGYEINKNIRVTAGANNIFDVYPDKNLKTQTAIRPSGGTTATYGAPTIIDLSNNNQFEYSRNVSQFGFNGRFVFVRAAITL